MVNPYFCYALSFVVALLTYMLGWSDLYPALTLSLLFFILFMVLVHLYFGIQTVKRKIITFTRIEVKHTSAPLLITLFLYILWSFEFLYEGGIPLLKIILKQPYNYRLFGIPSLHVFIVTFSSFYTIFLFHLYLSRKSFITLALYGINLAAALLIYNRGMLFFNLAASVFLYLIAKPKITAKQVAGGAIAVILLFFFFGVLGSLRVSREAHQPYSNRHFLQIGRATASFQESFIPPEFFWSYIYISSPLANLQQNINTYQPRPLTIGVVAEWINNEVIFDFISKRVNALTGKERENENTVPGPFNVSTIYSRSFSYLGWSGVVLMGVLILFLPPLFLKSMPQSSPFFLSGLAILNTLFLFMVFDNTLRFTGLSFQLMYPILLDRTIRYFPRVGKLFS